jgi:hypothetical protein
MSNDMRHFNQKPRRKAEIIRPPNTLKAKVGSGGISDDILEKAQTLLENNAVDFQPLAELYLTSMTRGLDAARSAINNDDLEPMIANIIYPAIQLKANGGMFHYQLVTKIADKLIQFMEVIEGLDKDALEIISAYQTTIRAVIQGRITGDAGKYGDDLIDALNEACMRYFDKNPHQRKEMDFNYIHKWDDTTP